jgi:hypothetical protein
MQLSNAERAGGGHSPRLRVAEKSNSEATPRNLVAGSRHEKTRRPCGVRAKSNSRELEETISIYGCRDDGNGKCRTRRSHRQPGSDRSIRIKALVISILVPTAKIDNQINNC